MKILPIAKIKAFPPGHVISGVRGKVLMVKAPVDPNEHDLKRARHRQSVQIMDAAGDKLWVQLTRSKHHIFPDQKGRILVLESISTDKGNALFYYKQSKKYKQEKKAERWKKRYFDLGGSKSGIRQSVKASAPLAGLSGRDLRDFKNALTEKEHVMLRKADEWYDKTYK